MTIKTKPNGASFTASEFTMYKLHDGKFAEMWFVLECAAIGAQ
jgi:predicted ester cyclase